MSSENPYENNPLHGIGLEKVLTDLVDQYNWDILAAYMNLNCFKNKPTIKASMKFLKKTDWAREKVEAFYLYQYNALPKADDANYELPPRERIIPAHIEPREPRELSLEDAENLRQKRAEKDRKRGNANSSNKSNNPYGNFS